MQSINYYIQLPDSLSTRIDSMGQAELIAMAETCLANYGIADNAVDCSATQRREASDYMQSLDVSMDDLILIAHGCLSKALY